MMSKANRSEATLAFRLCAKCSASSRGRGSGAKRRQGGNAEKGCGERGAVPLPRQHGRDPVARFVRYAFGRFRMESPFISIRCAL